MWLSERKAALQAGIQTLLIFFNVVFKEKSCTINKLAFKHCGTFAVVAFREKGHAADQRSSTIDLMSVAFRQKGCA